MHSDAYAAGELKHGTISLITDGVPVNRAGHPETGVRKDHLQRQGDPQPRCTGAAVHHKGCRGAGGVADAVVRLDEYEDLLMPLQLIVPLQLFAYYMAVLRGCDVDKPRNLAKSVTVE